MAEVYPSDNELLNIQTDNETGIEYIPTGTSPYYLHFRKLLYRLLLATHRANDLRVFDEGGLDIGVKAGKFWLGTQLISYESSSGNTLADDKENIYVYLDSAGNLIIDEYNGFPDMSATPHVRLAVVTTSSGDIVLITDSRAGHNFVVPGSSSGAVSVIVAAADSTDRHKLQADYVCDGTADDIEINASLSQVKAAGGGSVFLSSGSYTLADTIKIPSDVTLAGEGTATRLTFDTSVGDKTMITNDCNYTFAQRHPTGNKNIVVRDIYINGDKNNRSTGADSIWTVGFNTVENLTIENLTIFNGWTVAIRTEFCTYVTIANNRIHNSGDDGIGINEETYNCSCYGNRITDAGKGGKSYGAPNGIEVQDGSRDVSVRGNVIENCDTDGVQVSTHTGKDGCTNVTIDSNTVRNCESGVFVKGLSGMPQINVTVSNNVIIGTNDSALYGLQAAYTEDVVFVGNTTNNRINAGRLANSNIRTIISDNIFHCTQDAGNDEKGFLFSGTLTNVRFAGNIVNNYGWKGLEISGTVNNMHVVNNHIIGCTNASGAAVRWDSPTSNLCVLNGNHLQGTHWSYDAATSTYDMIADDWTETWNTKDT
ncbi:MAG: hypothetical protein A2167_02745 [Planctomycetes bacterium RBG_13_46_10]|nr:MAG: hypothetical protein A2167_02745 [Planctomycetes bacterium RBG_13_46_10]